VLLIFGNITDTFTDQPLNLCDFDFSIFTSICPPGVQITPQNFITEIKYVFILLLSFKFLLYCLYRKCNLSALNRTLPDIDLVGNIRQQSIWLTSKYCFSIRRIL
jgi:hypothetical protein